MKTFSGDFDKLLIKLKDKAPFSFSRYSDGEMIMMKGMNLRLAADHNLIGFKRRASHYEEEDYKDFDPNRDKWLLNMLWTAYRHKQSEYHVGVSCKCCVGDEDFQWMINELNNEEYATWSNLFVNANYPRFVKELVPELRSREVYLVANENAKVENLPFKVDHHFEIGTNEMGSKEKVEELISDLSRHIKENDIKGAVFLFSASSISNILNHRLFEAYPDNTYIDIGTCLHYWLDLTMNREYLRQYWSDPENPHGLKVCIW